MSRTMASVRFSDVVRRVNKFVDRHNTDLLYYVGGEHMESQELLVRQKGLIKGATIGYKFHFGFEPGHILFGSRNPHLKKCSMVDFAGVCSDSTYVVETRDPEVLDQRYLLLEMQSDRFWDWAEENKSGSVNYLINYCTLDEYEFDLPPIEKQRELADLLWAANDLKEAYRKAIAATDKMLKAKFREMFGDTARNTKKWKTPSFGECLYSIDSGKSFICQPQPRKGTFPAVLKLSAVTYGDYRPEENKAVNDSLQFNPDHEVHAGDLLFTRKNTIDLVGACAYVRETPPKLMLPDIIFRLNTKSCYDKKFLHALLTHPDQRRRLTSIAGGTNASMVNISKERLMRLTFPMPPLSLQREFVVIADASESTKASLKKSIVALDQVMKGLINA